ncbi:MAG: hypothetical protein ACFFCS_00405 [Candidatus Hodarchaeota archaeon]
MDGKPQYCSRCKKNRVMILREHSGERVCRACFLSEIQARVRKTISRLDMLNNQDKLALAVSGGKDSVVLVKVLFTIHENLIGQQAKNGKPPVMITIDEGIEGYREESIKITEKLAGEFNVQHVIFSLKKEFGKGLDEVVSGMSDNEIMAGSNLKIQDGQLKNASKLIFKPCSICGVLRRRILNDVAAGVGATKLATGHNLNDEVETFLLNVFKGDVNRLERGASLLLEESGPFVKKIKPLRNVLQKDIVLYLYHVKGDFQDTPCPYSREEGIFRGEIQEILNSLENNHPGTIFNINKFMGEILPSIARPVVKGTLSTCPSCNSLKSKSLEKCMPCYYIEKIYSKDYGNILKNFIDSIN